MEKRFSIVVDYSKSLSSLFKAGKYAWYDPVLCGSQFRAETKSGKAELNTELICHGRFTTTEKIMRDMKRRGLQPAKLSELLAIVVAYPEKRFEFPIVALGSVWCDRNGFRYVPCQHEHLSGGREMYLAPWEGVWQSQYRFAAVREAQPFQNNGDVIHGYPYPPKIFSKRVGRLKGEPNGKNLSYHR